VVVLDPGLLNIVKVTSGLSKNGWLVVNAKDISLVPADIQQNFNMAIVDATTIARELLGVPIVNTTMLGAILKAVPVVKKESLAEPLKKRFGRGMEKNVAALKRAYEETILKEPVHA
jgi:pyruvate ferredoxin oxidoreductase gamma subunit